METWIERARARIRAMKLTYDDLREPLGVTTRGAVSHYFSSRRQLSASQAVGLARRLECSVEWLLTGARQRTRKFAQFSALPATQQLMAEIETLSPSQYDAVSRIVRELAHRSEKTRKAS